MWRNRYFFVAGCLSFLFAAAHVAWGQQNVIAELRAWDVPATLVATVFMGWNLAASTTALSGVALIAVSRKPGPAGALPLAWFIVAINLGRYLLFLGTAAVSGLAGGALIVANTLTVAVYVGLIVLGIRQAAR